MRTLLVMLFTITVSSQTYIDIKGGAVLGEVAGGIGAGVSYDFKDVTVGASFMTYSPSNYNFDSYSVELGYIFLLDVWSIRPIFGVGYNKYKLGGDVIKMNIGADIKIPLGSYITVTSGYRNVNNYNFAFIGFRVRALFKVEDKPRFY